MIWFFHIIIYFVGCLWKFTMRKGLKSGLRFISDKHKFFRLIIHNVLFDQKWHYPLLSDGLLFDTHYNKHRCFKSPVTLPILRQPWILISFNIYILSVVSDTPLCNNVQSESIIPYKLTRSKTTPWSYVSRVVLATEVDICPEG